MLSILVQVLTWSRKNYGRRAGDTLAIILSLLSCSSGRSLSYQGIIISSADDFKVFLRRTRPRANVGICLFSIRVLYNLYSAHARGAQREEHKRENEHGKTKRCPWNVHGICTRILRKGSRTRPRTKPCTKPCTKDPAQSLHKGTLCPHKCFFFPYF